MTILCSADIDPTDLTTKYLGGVGVKVPLQFGDFVFTGSGWGDEPISICVERKRVRDLINSLVLEKRLVQQFRDARTAHQILYLIVEGRYREGSSGVVETVTQSDGREWWHPINCGTKEKPFYVGYSRLHNSLESVANAQGVQIRWTDGPQQTAKLLINLYKWWQLAPEGHSTTQSFYNGPMPLSGKLSLVRRVAKELPHIGWELSGRVEKRFRSVREMVNAETTDWEEIDGIGRNISQQVDMALSGGY